MASTKGQSSRIIGIVAENRFDVLLNCYATVRNEKCLGGQKKSGFVIRKSSYFTAHFEQ